MCDRMTKTRSRSPIERRSMRHLRLLIVMFLAILMPAVASAATRVTVQAGDTLDAIGQRYGVSAQAIAGYNGIADPGQIVAGQTVSVPASSGVTGTSSASSSGGYTVQPGENLGAIAARYGTTASALAAANGLANPDSVVAGTRIRIAGVGASSTGSVSSSSGSGSGYTVRAGDTLDAIGRRYGVSARAIASANGITNPGMISVGTSLSIPSASSAASTSSGTVTRAASGGSHTVRQGENLSTIAARYGTTASAIARANDLADPNVVVVGTRLVVSGGTATANSSSSSGSSTGGGYTVQPGENLGAIAARYGTTASAIARANGIADPNRVVAGTRITITSGGAAATTSTGTMTPVTAQTSGWSGQPSTSDVTAMIGQSAARYGVDPALVRAIAYQESGFWQGARSNVGAMGVMQLMPDTATWVGSSLVGRTLDPTNARDNIDGGAAYLAYPLRHTSSRDQAVASYYQGLGSVTSRGLYDDTKAYVGSVNTHYGVR